MLNKKILITKVLALFFFTSSALIGSTGNDHPTSKNSYLQSQKFVNQFNEGEFSLHSVRGFEENKGQVRASGNANQNDVKFVFTSGNLKIFLLEQGLAYQFTRVHYPEGYLDLINSKTSGDDPEKLKTLGDKIRTETFRMDMVLKGANKNAHITTEGRSEDYTNYYNFGALDVHQYTKVTYHEIYPGIDWVVYCNNNEVKYDFVLRPYADPSLIQLEFQHFEKLKLEEDGSITLFNRMGHVSEKAPISFQNGKNIETKFILQNNTVSFTLNKYDVSKTLIIDPSVIWATYYGSTGVDYGNDIAIDALGNVYLAGRTSSGTGIASGGHQNTPGGSLDAFLVKFNAGGTRLWATYYGGTSAEFGRGCATDAFGNVFLSGETLSTTNIASLGHQNSFGGLQDGFLVKFNSAGTRLWATYYGGSANESGYGCATDTAGNVYLTGITTSNANIAASGHQNSIGSGWDAYLVKFNAGGTRLWATYYGGPGNDYGYSCSTDLAGNVYLAGYTQSSVNITSSGHQNTFGGSDDAYLVKFNSAGTRLWATYYGDGPAETAYSCVTDILGNVYICGVTSSTLNIAFSGHQNVYMGSNDAYLAKFNSSGTRLWATYYGDTGAEIAYDCSTDTSGNVYLTGFTTSTANIASGGYQNSYAGNLDAMLVKFNAAGTRLWATYYGGTGSDFGWACSADALGSAYMAGYTASSSSIALNGYQNTIGGLDDAFLVKFCDGPPPPVTIIGNILVCSPSSAVYSIAPIAGATSYTWFVPAGWSGVQSANSITVSLTASGILSVSASNSCGTSAQQTLGVSAAAFPTLSVNSGSVCNGQSFTIVPSGASTYTITGNNFTVAPSVSTSYSVSGTSSLGCISTNTGVSSITVYSLPLVSAPGISVCLGASGTFSAFGAVSYTWLPGALTGSSVVLSPSVTSTYSVSGTSSAGCTGTASTSIFVLPVPTLSFTTYSITCASLGQATVYPTGGIGPFSFNLMPTAQNTSVALNLNPNTYTLSTFDAGTGCTSTATTIFTSLIPLTGSIAASSSLTCNAANTGTGSVTNLAGGSGNQSYLWTNGASTSSVAVPNNLSAGNWSVTVTDALTACQVYSVFTITQPSAFTLNITPSTPTACIGTSIVLTGTNSGGTPGYTYTWTAGPPTNALSVAQGTGGTYVYTLSSTDANTCTTSKTISIGFVVNPTLTANSVSICPLQTGTLSVTGASTYTWNGSLAGTTFTASPVGTQQYAVVGTALGCTAAATASIIVKPLPTPTISSNSPVCNGQNLLLGATGGTSYLWSGPLSYTSLVQNPVISAATPTQSGVYSVTVTGANSCTAPASTSVQVNPTPTISMSGGPVCLNSSLFLSANSFTGSSYFWTGPNSFTSSFQNPTITAVAFSAGGNYSLLVSSASSCTNISSLSVTVNPLPAVNISPSSTVICTAKSSTLSASGGLNYIWSTGSTATVLVLSPTVTTSYTVTGASALGCSNTAIKTISVNALPSVSVVVNPTVYCAGRSATLIASGANTYTWSTNASSSNIVASPLFTSFYNVRGTSAATGCSNTAFATVSVDPLPTIAASTTKSIICTGTSASITASGANTYTWLPGNSMSAMITPSPLVNTTYTVRGTISASGCSNTAVRTISVNTTPTVSMVSNTPSICIGWSAVITASGANTYTLNPGNLTGNSFTVSPPSTTQFSLSGTNSVNCVNLLPSNVNITVHNLKAIQGVVTSTTGQNNGNVVLYGYKPVLGKWDSLNTSLVILNNYTFPSVPSGSYVVKSFPFPTDLVETYGLSASSWKGASVINHNCLVNSTQNINIITFNNLIKSKATLSGKITQGAGYANPGSPGAPIPNITVKAGIYPGPRIYQTTRTNSAGQYTLANITSNLSGENYYILVDIPALDTNKTYHRIIITGFENFTNLDFVVDSQRIHPLNLKVGVKELSMLNSTIKVFPNPASEQITIELELNETEEVSIELFDLSGRKLKTLIPQSQQDKGKLSVLAKVEELKEGVYLIKIKIGNEEGILKLSIVR